MATEQCLHCGESLPTVHDAFCPFCRESLDESTFAPEPLVTIVSEPLPDGKITVDVSSKFPQLCVLCGLEAQRSIRLRFHREHLAKKTLLRMVGGLFGGLIADEAFDERPVDVSFPVCSVHMNDSRLGAIKGTPVGPRRVAIAGVHPTFVAAAKELSQNQWADLAQRMSDVDIER